MAHNGINGSASETGDVVPLWIDNKQVHSSRPFDVINSTTQKAIWRAYGADTTLAQQAVDSAARAFPSWSRTQPIERRRILLKAAEIFQSRRGEIIDIMMQETNCTRAWAEGINMTHGINFLDEIACLTTTSGIGSLPPTESADRLALVFKEPYGVILGIAPWNAAFILAIRAVATPIACGNTTILKASELSPKTHQMIGQVFSDAGLPPGVLNIVQHSREDAADVINTMIAHPAVRKINFTGSTGVGKVIATTAGSYLKPVLMELGGKSSCIVLEDADLLKAAKSVVTGGFVNHGQVCMGTERVIVMSSIEEQFRDALTKAAAEFSPGNAVTVAGAKKTGSLVENAVKKGARLEFGGEQSPKVKDGTLQPTIVSGVTPEMDLFYTESFGPTISFVTVNTVDEAIGLANDTTYGLSASVFSKDISKAIRCAKRIETGACHINGMTVHDSPFLPHGGVKESGFGRFGSIWGMDEFLQIKTITILDENKNKD